MGLNSRTSEPETAVKRLLERAPVTVVDEPSPLRQPARLAIAVGAVIAFVSSVLPWLILDGYPRDPVRSGWSGRADGFLLALVAAALFVLAANRSAAQSTTRTVRLLPLILGPTAVALWVGGFGAMEAELADWRGRGGTGSLQPWLFVCLTGTATMAAGAVWLGLRRGFTSLRTGDPGEEVIVTRADVVRAMIGTVGVLTGAVVGPLLVVSTDLVRAGPTLLVLAAGFGGLVGAFVAGRVARGLVRG